MADKNSITARMSIDPTQAVESIKKVQGELDNLGGKAQQLALQAGPALDDRGHAAKDLLAAYGLRKAETEGLARKLKESLHVAHPVLEGAGFNLGGFARLATGNLAAFGIAVGGAIAVGIEKVQEQAKLAQKVLGDSLNNPGLGKKYFAAAQESAKKFGVDVGNVTKGIGALNEAATDG